MPTALPPQFSRLLTPTQQSRVADLVRLHHFALIIELMGDKAVPPHILTQVKARGLYRKPRPDVLHRAFTFGKIGVIEPKVLGMSKAQFDAYVSQSGLKLSRQDVEALDIIRRSFGDYLETLAEDMVSKINKAVLKADKKLQRRLAQMQRRSLFLEIEKRKALASIAKDMAAITETQVSRASMTIHTETNNAYQDGRAQEILRKSGGGDPLVFKRPRHDACPECVDAYLEDDRVTPRVFRLSELIDNGTNVGKSKHDRLPVIESHHPWCACELHWLPPGFGFGSRGEMIYEGRSASA